MGIRTTLPHLDTPPLHTRQAQLLDERIHLFSEKVEKELQETFCDNLEDLVIIQAQDKEGIIRDAVILDGKQSCKIPLEQYTLFGTNCARETIMIANVFYDQRAAKILEHTAENDKIVEKLSRINAFRQRLNKLKEGIPEGKNIEFTREEDRKLVNELLEVEECKDLFTKGEYTLKNKSGSLDRLDRNLVDAAKTISSPHVNFNMMKMQENFNERNRVMEIVMEIVRQYTSAIHVIIQNFVKRTS